MAEVKGRYVHGTAAEKLNYTEYDVYEENRVLKDKKNAKQNRKIKLKMVFNLLVVFFMFGFITYRYALITDLNYRVNSASTEYERLKNDNQILKVNIRNATDLEKIKERAETKLGMQTPDKAQIVYVNVPKRDFTEVSEAYRDNGKNEGVFKSLFSKVGGIAGILN